MADEVLLLSFCAVLNIRASIKFCATFTATTPSRVPLPSKNMISITDLKNKKLTLVIWNVEKEDDVRVFPGEMIEGRDGLYFVNELLNWNLHLDEDKISRIKEIPYDIKEMLLNADYCINLSLGKLPDGPLEEYIKTELKWD